MSDVEIKTKSRDPRVAAAIAHWAPRFVSNGVLLTGFEEVTAGIERWEDLCAGFSRSRVVKRIYADLAVIEVTPRGLVAGRLVPGLSFYELERLTGVPLLSSGDRAAA